MRTRQLSSFEKDVNDELFLWVVRNEHLRRNTGQHYRIFTYRDTDKIEVNLNCFRSDYLEKFVKIDHQAYFQELLKRIEPIIFKVMAMYEIKNAAFNYEFYYLTWTYTKKVSYSFETKIG